MDYENYLELIKRINESYGTTVDVEHQHIHEFFEGPHPLFKLILSKNTENDPIILIVSFHLELPTESAIQWFLRIRQLDPNLHITGCYLKDAQGNSHVGEDAEILKMYILEQEVLSVWIKSTKDEEEVLKKVEVVPVQTAQRPTFIDAKTALQAFSRMSRKKSDTFH